jgi:hypothetical protein
MLCSVVQAWACVAELPSWNVFHWFLRGTDRCISITCFDLLLPDGVSPFLYFRGVRTGRLYC